MMNVKLKARTCQSLEFYGFDRFDLVTSINFVHNSTNVFKIAYV